MDLLNYKKQELSILADPFKTKCITEIVLRAATGFWSNEQHLGICNFTARVSFTNGNTKGEQSIKADSFEDLITKVKAFVDSLN